MMMIQDPGREEKVLGNDILMYMIKVYFMEDKC